jgi:uncharacterized protein (TIGR02145 family)
MIHMKNIFITAVFLTLPFSCLGQTVTDIDGNVYNTVTIGQQTWMKENLRVTKFNDGSDIPVVTDSNKWINLSTPAMCTYNNTTDTGFINTYGRLYNWYVVKTKKLCPVGWHVPTYDEWNGLINYLGGIYSAYHKMREAGTLHWNKASDTVDNSSGFTALPGGYRHPWSGSFVNLGNGSDWWSSSDYSSTAGFMGIFTELMLASAVKNGIFQYGNSIRCLEDKNTYIKKDIEANNISVYPNPAKDFLYIKNVKTTDVSIEIVNLQGELMLCVQNISNSVYIGNLESGIYLLRLINLRNIQVIKIVKK